MGDDPATHLCVVLGSLGQVDRQRRAPERSVLDKQFQRFIIHQHSLLDRAHAASNRVLRAFTSVSVSRYVAMPARSFGDYGFHVIERYLTERLERDRINVPQRSGGI